jgi:hypothetical protein
LVISDRQQIQEWNVVQVCTQTLSKTIACLQAIFCDASKSFSIRDIERVLIEKQPSRNTKMRIMENTLHMFFLLHHVPSVVGVNAKNKLGNIGKSIKGTHNYNLRKKYSVMMCRKYLDDYLQQSSWSEHFSIHKKKDDLADCLLQYLSCTNPNTIQVLANMFCSIDD